MEDINIKFKEIQRYLIDKILNKEFEIKKIDEHTMEIEIDSEYCFSIWLGNWDVIDACRVYSVDGKSSMYLGLIRKERIKLKSVIQEDVDNYQKDVILKQKRKQLEQLKKELGDM